MGANDMKKHVLLATTAFALYGALAHADQAAVLNTEQAEMAGYALALGAEIRHFCAPCGDTTWRPELVATLSAEPWQGEKESVELKVNGEPIDLAYVYVYQGGGWTNLARYTGVEVVDVPEKLNVAEVPASPGFGVSHFRGTLDGDKAILATLVRGGDKVSGTYFYGHMQKPIGLYGAIDPDGGALLKEFAAAESTGTWRVKVQQGGRVIGGDWETPDGAKKLPVALKAFAVPSQANMRLAVNPMNTTASFSYPVFTSAGHAKAAELNVAMRKVVDEQWTDYRNAVEEIIVGGELVEMEDIGPSMTNWDHGMEDYKIAHCTDSLVSISYLVYDYAGGAHPNSYWTTANWVISGDKVRDAKLEDFLATGEESFKALTAFLIADLKKQEAASVVDGTTTEFRQEEVAAFTVSPMGLTFYFSPYAVGPYAQGDFTVAVSWKDLGEHGKKDLVK
jgi:hypothetical protein